MPRNRPLAALLVALAASLGVALATPAPAAAATPCWKRLINDWYDGRIDQAYPVRCYRQAIKNLPEDVKAYSSAREDIRRALLAAFRSNRGKPLGPNAIVRPPGDGRSSPARRVGAREVDDERAAGGATSRDDDDSGGPLGAFFEALAPGKADSIPLPLIVLAALAMLLLAAAAAGLVTRRVQARRAPAERPSEVDPPPPFWPQNPPLRR